MSHALQPKPASRKPNPLYDRIDRLRAQRPAAMAVARKVGYQFPATPEGNLMRAIFQFSVADLFLRAHRRSACLHLQGRIFEAEICGIDADWIREQLRKAGVSLEECE